MSPPHMFASPPDVKAVVTLILIENSEGMRTSWDVLRQHYLPTLLGTMRIVNPVVPIPVLWLITAPVGDDATDLHSAPPRQYNQLPELKFNFSPDNKITSRIINRATELMLEAAAQFQPGPISFHLFIVAASTPAQGTCGVPITMPTQIGQSEWHLLSQRMTQLKIHCHMILPASQNMSAMHELFVHNLELQGHTQVIPWFPTTPEYIFLLAGNPSPNLPYTAADLTEQQLPFPAARPSVQRHQSFPQDAQSVTAVPAPVQNDPTPCIVSSLQKVHGLSRKKLYGTQPPRQPFVREEPVRTKYMSTPTPLSIPVGSQPLPVSEDGRAVGRTKAERGRRTPHIGDLSSSPGRSSWNCAPSDVGSSPSSPSTTSVSSQHTTSPTIPLYPDLTTYATGPPTTSTGFSPTVMSPVPIPDSSLHDPSGEYFSMSPSYQPPPASAIPVPSHGPVWTSMTKPGTSPMGKPVEGKRHSQELPHGPHIQSLSAMSTKYRLDSVSAELRSGAKNTQRVRDAGDVPFIFSPELEAATAAKLRAALQSTSPTIPTATSPPFPALMTGNSLNYTAGENPHLPMPAQVPSQPPTLVAPRSLGYSSAPDPRTLTAWTSGRIDGGDGEPHVRFVGGTSSSLQGWAG